jgi:hypothetical protein
MRKMKRTQLRFEMDQIQRFKVCTSHPVAQQPSNQLTAHSSRQQRSRAQSSSRPGPPFEEVIRSDPMRSDLNKNLNLNWNLRTLYVPPYRIASVNSFQHHAMMTRRSTKHEAHALTFDQCFSTIRLLLPYYNASYVDELFPAIDTFLDFNLLSCTASIFYRKHQTNIRREDGVLRCCCRTK